MEEKKYEVVIKIFVLQLAAMIMIMPFVWLVSTALKNPSEVFTENLTLLPETFRWANFVEIMDQAPFWLYMSNTIIVCVGILIIQLFLVIPAAYAFARLDFQLPVPPEKQMLVLRSLIIPRALSLLLSHSPPTRMGSPST